MEKGSPKMQTIIPGAGYAIAKKLAESWLPHLVRTEGLFAHLDYVDRSSKEMRTEALRLGLLAFDELLAKEVPEGRRFKEYRSRTIITPVGKIACLRRIYTEPSGIAHAYLDEILGIRTRAKLAPDAFIWIVRTASDISCRKTARAFFERTGAKVSPWLVYASVHEEGSLLPEEAYRRAFGADRPPDEPPLSSETLFVGFDGIHIPLQKTAHGPRKERWVYERDRKKHSFGLKAGCFCAGKNDKRRRLGCAHVAFGVQAALFWPPFNAQTASVCGTEVTEAVHSGADGAGRCKNRDLGLIVTAHGATRHLDRFHLNREIRRAFGGRTNEAPHLISLAYRKKAERMMGDLQLATSHAGEKRRRALSGTSRLLEGES